MSHLVRTPGLAYLHDLPCKTTKDTDLFCPSAICRDWSHISQRCAQMNMDSPATTNDALSISVGKGDAIPPPSSSDVAAAEQNKLSPAGTPTAADPIDQDEETLSIPSSEGTTLPTPTNPNNHHSDCTTQEDPPEEVRSCTSCPIDVDTCSPWEIFDEDFKTLPTDSAPKQMDLSGIIRKNNHDDINQSNDEKPLTTEDLPPMLPDLQVETFQTSSEDSHGDGWTEHNAHSDQPFSISDSNSRCKSWAKLLLMFVLGAILGGILVAYTPLGGSPSSSTTSSSAPSGSEEAITKDNMPNSPVLSPTTSPTFEALAGKETQTGVTDQVIYNEDQGKEETMDVLHNSFEEVLPNEQNNMEESESTPDMEDEETAVPQNTSKIQNDEKSNFFDNDIDIDAGGIELDTEKNIYPIDDHEESADPNMNTNTTTTSPQADGSIPYTGDGNEDDDDDLTYVPGDLSQLKKGLLLSRGLDVAIIAQSNRPVVFANGTLSKLSFHGNPDFGATFAYPDDDESNPGGYVYVSNAEIKRGGGGVGAIYFNRDGGIIDYKMLLRGTSMNCGGGRTFWNTWISCEEKTGDRSGQIYQVDPFDRRPPEETVMGGSGGAFESFAYRLRQGSAKPRFFVTEDDVKGSLRRFTPARSSINMSDPWAMLHGEGQLDYLLLWPNKGTYGWTQDKARADQNAKKNYQQTEGIDVKGNRLYFVSKAQSELFVLNLDSNTYAVESTVSGVFDGSPDQLVRLVGDGELLYYTEEGGKEAGIHARDNEGRYFTILESPVYEEETTGLAFSPDHRHLYVAYQKNGILLDVWRKDGGTFSGSEINVKYHATETTGVV